MSTTTLTRTLTQNLKQSAGGKRLGTTANGSTQKAQLRASSATESSAPSSAPSCTIQVFVHAEIAGIIKAGPYTLRVGYLEEGDEVSKEYDRDLELIETDQGAPGLSDKPPLILEGVPYHFANPVSFKLDLGIEPKYWIDHNPDITPDPFEDDDGDFEPTYQRIEFGQIYEVDSNGNGSINPDRRGKFPSERVFGFSNDILARPYVFKSRTREPNGRPKQVSTSAFDWPPGDGFWSPLEDREYVQVWFERDPKPQGLHESGFDWGDQTKKWKLDFHASDTNKKLYLYADGNWSNKARAFEK